MAVTIRSAPSLASPATKTLATFVPKPFSDRAALGVAEVHIPEEAVAHGASEADGEQHEICLYLEVRALFGDGLAVRGTLGLDGVHLFDVAVCTREAFDGD